MSRQILIPMVMLATLWHSAVAQPKKNAKIQVNTPPPFETVLAGTNMQSNPVLSDLVSFQPEMPLGPQDVLKSYEDELGGGQDIGRFLCNRAGSTNKSNYPRTGGISFAAEIPNGTDAVSSA
jgi:hypothetical protein